MAAMKTYVNHAVIQQNARGALMNLRIVCYIDSRYRRLCQNQQAVDQPFHNTLLQTVAPEDLELVKLLFGYCNGPNAFSSVMDIWDALTKPHSGADGTPSNFSRWYLFV